MADITDTNTPQPWYQSILDTVAKAGTVYLSLEQQKQLNNINTDRAARGLAPLDATQYQAGVNVGVSTSTQNTLMILVGGGLAVWLLTSLLKRR